ATRLAGPLIDRVSSVNPSAVIAAYGLYAPLNAHWLREHGVSHVLGPEVEPELLGLVREVAGPGSTSDVVNTGSPRRTREFIAPARDGLPSLTRYAALRMPDGSTRVVGNTDATRGCKHLCRHCPIVPVYRGHFYAVPIDVVFEDIHAQISAGAQHI